MVTTLCLACGCTHELLVPCGLRHWCAACARARAQAEYKRLARALDARVRQQRAAWLRAGRERHAAPQLRLLTLTVRHGDDLAATRKIVADAWPRLRRWLHTACGYAPAFAATWEVTDGADGKGHPHLHICAVLPFLPLREMASAWVKATGGKAEAQGLDLRTVTAGAGARYVAAYVTASALDAETTEATAAAWIQATHGRRLVHASRHFWLEDEHTRCHDCGSTEPLSARVRALESAPTLPRGPP